MPRELTFMTEERIHSINFSESDFIKMLRALDVNKVRNHDNTSVIMIKFCANSIAHQLTLVLQNSLCVGTFAT